MIASQDEQTQEVARAIAAAMGGFHVENMEGVTHNAYLVDDDDPQRRLLVWRGYKAGRTDRLEISGVFPNTGDDAWYRFEQIRIGVGVTRDPEAIARDIERRLLPQYDAALAQVKEYIVMKTGGDAERQALGERLADVVGGSYRDNPRTNRGTVHWRGMDAGYGEVELYSFGSGEGSVNIQIRGVSPEIAERVLRGLMGLD
jgi:hypothetical protein